jgi:hypothetical protein
MENWTLEFCAPSNTVTKSYSRHSSRKPAWNVCGTLQCEAVCFKSRDVHLYIPSLVVLGASGNCQFIYFFSSVTFSNEKILLDAILFLTSLLPFESACDPAQKISFKKFLEVKYWPQNPVNSVSVCLISSWNSPTLFTLHASVNTGNKLNV